MPKTLDPISQAIEDTLQSLHAYCYFAADEFHTIRCILRPHMLKLSVALTESIFSNHPEPYPRTPDKPQNGRA